MKVTGITYYNDPNYKDICEFCPPTEEDKLRYSEAYDVVVNWLKENGYKYSGFTHQGEYVPIIDNKWLFQTSFRSWGGIMADALGLGSKRNYCIWAWTAPEKEVLPEKGVRYE